MFLYKMTSKLFLKVNSKLSYSSRRQLDSGLEVTKPISTKRDNAGQNTNASYDDNAQFGVLQLIHLTAKDIWRLADVLAHRGASEGNWMRGVQATQLRTGLSISQFQHTVSSPCRFYFFSIGKRWHSKTVCLN